MPSKFTNYDGTNVYYYSSDDESDILGNGKVGDWAIDTATGEVFLWDSTQSDWVSMFTMGSGNK